MTKSRSAQAACMALMVALAGPGVGAAPGVGPVSDVVRLAPLVPVRPILLKAGAVASSGVATNATDGNPLTAWVPTGPSSGLVPTARHDAWIAMPLSEPAGRTLVASWHAQGFGYLNLEAAPLAYRWQASTDSTDGRNGVWLTLMTVPANTVRGRADTLGGAVQGARWIRLRIDAGGPALALQDIGIATADVPAGLDCWFFLGDSVTDASFNSVPTHDFVATLHAARPTHWPVVIDGGTSGDNTRQGLAKLPGALALCPPGSGVGIGFGGNDCGQRLPLSHYRANLQAMIDAVRLSGRVPMLARTSWHVRIDVAPYVAIVDDLVRQNGLAPGADLYTWFRTHPEELKADGIHPTEAGRRSIQRLWGSAVAAAYGAE
ncbi:MAG: hypothetical protein H7338_19110 [Candidatus Sericytochromatia bacterium]|nr:hypothetical protein [Candidatus Sericytochromatia bacterium]